jgi:hypothetical protein
MTNKQVAFKVDEGRLTKLAAEAKRKGLTVAGLTRQWVYEKLDETEQK